MHTYLVILVLFFSACSGITILNEKDYYSPEFLKKLSSIQIIYKDGDKQLALNKINAIDDSTISRDEQAKKYNFKGVLLFSLGDIDKAIESFEKSHKLVGQDVYLKADVALNLASSYYKIEKYENTNRFLNSVDVRYLKAKEKENFHRLVFTLALQSGDHLKVVNSLMNLVQGVQTFKDFENFKYKEILIDNFKKLSVSERVDILYNYNEENRVAVAYLARIEALGRFYLGDRDGAGDVVSWMGSKFSDIEDVRLFVEDYKFRSDNFSKISTNDIGVVVPMSGKFARYGEKVMAGVNTALGRSANSSGFNIHVKDNQNNALLAKNKIQELVLKNHVSVIIGGLFPSLAKAEYLEARKYGVMYIALSQVYLPRSEKSHLLLEVQGSVESQVESMTKPNVLDKFGRRVAILYPESDAGKSYMSEMWSLFSLNKLELTNIYSFTPGIEDYREHVKAILGLKYPREREEEYKIWKEIKDANKSNVRVVNVLPPVVDFDWVFLPTLPTEAIQILPTFSFFDAKNISFIGGPSWINNNLKREKRNLGGKLYLIGNDTADIKTDFIQLYKEKNETMPQLVDTLSYEGMSLALSILDKQNYAKREDMAQHILSIKNLDGITSKWNLTEGIWLKEMDIMTIQSRGFSKINI